MATEQKKYTYTEYDPTKNTAYQAALDQKNVLLETFNSDKYKTPFTSSYDDALATYLEDYQKRNEKGFSYDFNADALYQQYKDKYIQQGKMAMQDTMGQAAAMTGGYGNSYAQSVGQQAYQASLDNLNDIIPELYQMAYDRYNQEGQDMLNTITLLRGERDNEYAMYNDEYAKLLDQLSYYTTEEQNAYNRGYTEHSDAQKYAYQAVADENAFNQWLAQLGLNERQVELQEKQYETQYGNSSKSYSGTTKTGKNFNNGTLTNGEVKELQAALGVEADGYYGSISQSAAGGLTANEAYEKFVGKAPENDEPQGSSYEDALSYLKTMKAQGKSNADVSAFLVECVQSGSLTGSEQSTLYNLYRDNKLEGATDNRHTISLKDSNWDVYNNNKGGANLWGIDKNAEVVNQNGKHYTLDQLVDALIEEGMTKKQAKAYVIKLQQDLDISKRGGK